MKDKDTDKEKDQDPKKPDVGKTEQNAGSGSGNYDNDIPIDENVVNYRTNKTAGEEGKKVALKDNSDTESPDRQ